MSENTVFVIGAGASKEVNLLTGLELKKKIAQLLVFRIDSWGHALESGDHVIFNALMEHVLQTEGAKRSDINPYLHEAKHITEALPQATSIDSFIDSQAGNDKIALCGKLAIVRSILSDERRSLLYYEQENDLKIMLNRLENTWYQPFFQLLTDCRPNDIKQRFKSITFIIFNYDRCVEHFIFHALQNYYRLEVNDIIEIIKEINIYHPYGVVGTLPWAGQNGPVEFGAQPQSKQLLELSQKIKTFSEGTDPEASDISKIKQQMYAANKVVFLGFAFHKLNMLLLNTSQIDDTNVHNVRCFATALGISDSEQEIIKQQITDLYPKVIDKNLGGYRSPFDIQMTDLTCAELFQYYRRSLSF